MSVREFWLLVQSFFRVIEVFGCFAVEFAVDA